MINKLNNKFYIGKDKNNNPNYLGSGKLIKRAIKKYGKENFKKEILEECKTDDELNKREIYWINKLKPKYNIAKGGNGGYLLKFASDDIKQKCYRKIKNKLKGRKITWGNKIGKSLKGKPKSEDHKKKIKENFPSNFKV